MKKFLYQKVKNIKKIIRIKKEASNREFFRIFFDRGSVIAMVYPQENREEIGRITEYTSLFKRFQIPVPEILENIDNRIILQEDLGDGLIQKIFSRAGAEEKKKILDSITGMLFNMRRIPTICLHSVLDRERMIWEMNFFLTHFAMKYFPGRFPIEELKKEIYSVAGSIRNIDTFSHRDFHSRNMIYHKKKIFLVDFQDSLVAPKYYDLVSFAFDSYLDLKRYRIYFFKNLEKIDFKIKNEQFYLTALQRNIKALGTFGFQVTEKRNLSYRKYIHRTIHNINSNEQAQSRIPVLLGFLKRLVT